MRRIILFALSLTVVIPVFSQTTPVQAFEQFRSRVYQEKLFVHLDRETYLTGEFILASFFLVHADDHTLANTSAVAYMDVLDASGASVLETKIPLSQGRGSCSVFVPATLTSGKFQLRAYTKWMRNGGPAFFFTKELTIINPFTTPLSTAPPKNKPAIRFFPEGGNVVNGIRQRFAFEVTDENGKGINFPGKLMNEQGEVVADLEPVHEGRGTFYITPRAGDKYTPRFESVADLQFKFPQINQDGMVMELQRRDSIVEVQIRSTGEFERERINILIHTRQLKPVSLSGVIKNNEARFEIPLTSFAEGVSHLTLFDSELHPICERLFFKPVKQPIAPTLQAPVSVTPRGKTEIKIQNTGNDASASITVYRLDSLTNKPAHGIVEYLWLTSDIPGVNRPEQFFVNGESALAHADLLMMTKGWSRFKWESILSNQVNLPHLPESSGHLVEGIVTDQSNVPVPGINAVLASPGRKIDVLHATSNDKGQVSFQLKNFEGSRLLVGRTTQPDVYLLQLKSPFETSRWESRNTTFTLSPKTAQTLTERSVSLQVQDVFYSERFHQIPAFKDTVAFYGKADKTYMLDDYTRFPVMEEVLREYVSEVWVRKRKDDFILKVVDRIKGGVFDEEPLVLIDGVPITTNEMMKINPILVKKLDVITGRFFAGPVTYPGIVSFSTYGNDLNGIQLAPSLLQKAYEGFQMQREFYEPVYDSDEKQKSPMPDRRHVIAWKPIVNFKRDEAKTMNFYASDIPGTYVVVCEIIDKNGKAGTSMTTFVVRNLNP